MLITKQNSHDLVIHDLPEVDDFPARATYYALLRFLNQSLQLRTEPDVKKQSQEGALSEAVQALTIFDLF